MSQRVGANQRDIAVEHECRPALVEMLRRLHHGVAGAQLGFLHDPYCAVLFNGPAHELAAEAIDDADDLRRELFRGIQNVFEQRPPRQAMQHLGRARVHALARTRGENDDVHEKRREFSRDAPIAATRKNPLETRRPRERTGGLRGSPTRRATGHGACRPRRKSWEPKWRSCLFRRSSPWRYRASPSRRRTPRARRVPAKRIPSREARGQRAASIPIPELRSSCRPSTPGESFSGLSPFRSRRRTPSLRPTSRGVRPPREKKRYVT